MQNLLISREIKITMIYKTENISLIESTQQIFSKRMTNNNTKVVFSK